MNQFKKKPNILIVDDVEINCKLLARALQNDYAIQVASNGMAALEIAMSKNPPGLILLDIMMPEMDGYEVCRRLKTDKKTRPIPVIFITAANEEKNETDGFNLGAVDYITKPFNPAVVKARVKTQIDLKNYSDHLEHIVEERTRDLATSNKHLQAEIIERKQAQEDLRLANEGLEKRVKERTYEILQANSQLKSEIAERKRVEEAVKENEAYLKTIMATTQTGAVIVESDTHIIFDANNSFAEKIANSELTELFGKKVSQYVHPADLGSSSITRSFQKFNGTGRIFQATANNTVYLRQVSDNVFLRGRKYSIQSFSDVTEIINLLKTQEVNIDLAKEILNLVNGHIPRYTPLSAGRMLFADVISVPCHAEGGDHYFMRSVGKNKSGGPEKTVISLKDQSGHEVSCILRSIVTDFFHNAVLSKPDTVPIDQSISQLNMAICQANLFREDDFFTSINMELDHETLILQYISAGHPPFLLIRGNEVNLLPQPDQPGVNLPIGFSEKFPFSFGEHQLQADDRLIFYTDGLTEMPLKNGGQLITSAALIKIVEKIIRPNPAMPVSEIIYHLIETVSQMSHEKVIPPSINTSADDITVLGLEIENRDDGIESIFNPHGSKDISERINQIFTQVKKEWRQHGFGEPRDSLHIILEEAILNAWRHGNKNNPEKSIIVRRRFGNDFHMEIIDEGQGFDPESALDPTSPENLTNPSGRGIFLIQHYADKVVFEKEGRQIMITLEKHLYPEKEKTAKQTAELVEMLKA